LLDEYIGIKNQWLQLDSMPLQPQVKAQLQREAQLFEQSGIMKANLRSKLDPLSITPDEYQQKKQKIEQWSSRGMSNFNPSMLSNNGAYWQFDVDQNVKGVCNIVSNEITKLQELTKHPVQDSATHFPKELKTLISEKNLAQAQGQQLDPAKEQELRRLLAEQGEYSCQKFLAIQHQKMHGGKTS